MPSSQVVGLLAGVVNFSILAMNLGFTRADDVAAYNADVFSPFGQAMVVVWGLAFIAAGRANAGPEVWVVFAVEKLCYVIAWTRWILGQPEVVKTARADFSAALASEDPLGALAPMFHLMYGGVDALFLVLFLLQAMATVVDAAVAAAEPAGPNKKRE